MSAEFLGPFGAIVNETGDFEALSPFGAIVNETESGALALVGSALTGGHGTQVPSIAVPL